MTRIGGIPDNSIIQMDGNIIGVFNKNDNGSTSIILADGSVTSRNFDMFKQVELIETYDNAIEMVIGMSTQLV